MSTSLYFFLSPSLSLSHSCSFRFFRLAWQPRWTATAGAVDGTQPLAKGKAAAAAAATTMTLIW